MNIGGRVPERAFGITVVGTEYAVGVQRFTATEMVSECYQVHLWLVCEDEIAPADIVEKEATLTLPGEDEDRHFHGIIKKFAITGRNGRFYLYQATLVPRFHLLSLNSDYRIFQEKSVVEIVDEVLKAKLPQHAHEFRLIQKYEKRRYCTQFGESDLTFLSRLLEEEGIFYFFEHFPDRHILVLADDKAAYTAIAGGDVQYKLQDGMAAAKEVVTAFVLTRGITPGKVTSRDYNFKKPSLDLSVQQEKKGSNDHEVFEYPGNYGHRDRGARLAQVRLEEKSLREEYAEGSSNCRRLTPARTFTLSEHDCHSVNGTYVIVRLSHTGTQSHVLGEQTGIGGDCTYANEFLAVPASRTIRPERLLMKPYASFQTAVVVGPPGEEIHADEYGRVKVQFHWDREGRKTEKSSCWLRISQPWSGQSWGMLSIPRVGDEVLVGFINGDPDWPIVVGSVNNAQSPALYSLPHNKTQSGIRTRSYPNGGGENYHELRFEDRRGCEEIFLQSERDWNVIVKNDKGQVIGNDETLLVKNDRKKTVAMNQSESIGVNNSLQVGVDHREQIGVNRHTAVGANNNVSVGGNSAESIGLAKELTIGGLYQVTVGGVMNETVAGAKTEEVGLAKAVIVGANMTEQVIGSRRVNVGNTFQITAGESFQINCGSSTFRMDSDGSVYINGARFEFAASGGVKVTGEDIQLN